MAEESPQIEESAPEEPQKKKKGKLPVIIGVVVLLLSGGYFLMGTRKGEKEAPEPKLGEQLVIGEFLVNLKDGDFVYLQVDVSVHMAEGQDTGHMSEALPALQDAALGVLMGHSLAEVHTEEKREQMQRAIAFEMNKVLNAAHAAEGEHHEEPEHPPTAEDLKHKDWDSDTGPVLKVYFTKFATQ